MANSLDDAVVQFQRIVRKTEGIRSAPDHPPENIAMYPFAVCYPAEGSYKIGPPSVHHGVHTFWLEIHWARKDMPRDVEAATKMIHKVARDIHGAYKNSESDLRQVIDAMGNVDYTFGVLNWLGIETVGIRYIIRNVKIQEEIW